MLLKEYYVDESSSCQRSCAKYGCRQETWWLEYLEEIRWLIKGWRGRAPRPAQR